MLNAEHTDDYCVWLRLWSELPAHEVFAHPAYVQMLARPGQKAMCATFCSDDGVVIFPFVLRSLGSESFVPLDLAGVSDVTSPYGYGGAFFSGRADLLADQFWSALLDWYVMNGVVAEFVRLSVFAEEVLPYPGQTQEIQKNVIRSLEMSETDLWHDFERKVRKNVRRAESEGVRIEVDTVGTREADFVRVYHDTLDRRCARSEYYVSPAFLHQLHTKLGGRFAYFHALRNEDVISTELVLISETTVYSYFGGTLADAFRFRPNELLKYKIMLWSKARGLKHFVLGGGAAGEDGIFSYKKSFAPNGTVPFRIGRRVISPDTYQRLVAARQASAEGSRSDARANFFPAYRA